VLTLVGLPAARGRVTPARVRALLRRSTTRALTTVRGRSWKPTARQAGRHVRRRQQVSASVLMVRGPPHARLDSSTVTWLAGPSRLEPGLTPGAPLQERAKAPLQRGPLRQASRPTPVKLRSQAVATAPSPARRGQFRRPSTYRVSPWRSDRSWDRSEDVEAVDPGGRCPASDPGASQALRQCVAVWPPVRREPVAAQASLSRVPSGHATRPRKSPLSPARPPLRDKPALM